ncbi:aminotransferase class V-fold PLP-dependent enzyme [Candidatus Peregrinibacteria bacterium]|nr:aminotransferase class V-fold PLP-dependent enzyme [Candidatus Peregrinibacteria bacterium]
MNETNIYFDNNATTKLIPPVIEEVTKIINTSYGNPSSSHTMGDFGRNLIQNAKEEIARFLNTKSKKIIFTSGCSESNSTILQSILVWRETNKTIITSPIEHSSVLKNCEYLETQGVKIIFTPIEKDGIIKLDDLEDILKMNPNSLLSIGWVNNETGIIQPIEQISKLAKKYNCLIHSDAAQMVGRGKINLNEIDLDFLSFTGHKLHAPKGIGIIYAKNPSFIRPLIWGGEQEFDKRAGTENLIGIGGLYAAVKERANDFENAILHLRTLRDKFEEMILQNIPDVFVNGCTGARVPNTTNLGFKGIDGRALVAQLDLAGIICSQTSACTSMIPEPSYVLQAMGLNEDEAFSSIRFSFGIDNDESEINFAVNEIKNKVDRIRNLSFLNRG